MKKKDCITRQTATAAKQLLKDLGWQIMHDLTNDFITYFSSPITQRKVKLEMTIDPLAQELQGKGKKLKLSDITGRIIIRSQGIFNASWLTDVELNALNIILIYMCQQRFKELTCPIKKTKSPWRELPLKKKTTGGKKK